LSAALEANNKVAQAVKVETDEIRGGSEEQVRGIAEISKSISQMSHVTQGTAAQAEQSASAATELCPQSEALKRIVESLGAMVGGG